MAFTPPAPLTPPGRVAGRLYLDNAATSFPKPPAVLEAMIRYATDVGASAGRGGYAEALESMRVLDECRAAIARLISAETARHVIFTLNCTDALNLAIKGVLDAHPSYAGADAGGDAGGPAGGREKPHVICTASDHNSILRPLTALRDAGRIDVSVVDIDPRTALVDPDDIRKAWRRSTRLICATHVSNVTGTLHPIGAIGRLARERAVPFVVDAAQSIGHLPIDVQREHIDLLAAPGHKGLMGPLGTGFLYVRPGMERLLRPLREGGTGSRSDEPRQPETLPDKYESGSHNTIGLAGLAAGVAWVLERGVESIAAHEQALVRTFIENASDIEGLSYFGPQGVRDRIGVFSVAIDGLEPADVAGQLEARFGILTRAGLHCAPLMHTALGTVLTGGTTRLSFGPFVSVQDVRYATDALATIAGSSSATRGQHTISNAIG